MTLKLYKQSATPNRVDKSGFLNDVGEVSTIIVKGTENTLTPDFLVQTNATVYNANYFFCDFTSRYYYITGYDVTTGGRMIIHSRVDVLMTFRNEILSSSAWVLRSDRTTDESDNYEMLHNDYPFRQDYDVMGMSSFGSIFTANPVMSGNNIVLIMK